MANNRSHHKSFFMPMLCRFSINDTINTSNSNSKSSDSSSSTDPQSPKLSCIGQIKKRSGNGNVNGNDRFISCRLSASATGKTSVHGYTKLRRLFSGKNLISPAIDTASVSNNCGSKCKSVVTKRSSSCNGRRGGGIPISAKKCYVTSSGGGGGGGGDRNNSMRGSARVTVAEELDPPLPVVKTRRGDGEENVNLWKRRGIEMKTLQIQPIQLRIELNATNNNNGKFSFATSSASTF
ncbi:hypothetical protein OSB04_004994 [Centaurea solstitialis]|uniref:Uncharacterized protein n=1 Tax=Centaurea solstitialis TaxID=347529 RepID=A0AA38WR68_9ASTR|nr:hypothetical protein OSB04_004994 [Centaurea solstitialis]